MSKPKPRAPAPNLKTLTAILPEIVPNDAKFVEVTIDKSGNTKFFSLYNPAIDDFEMCNLDYRDLLTTWSQPKHLKIWQGLFTLIASGMPMESAANRVSIPSTYIKNWYTRGKGDIDRNIPSPYAWLTMQIDKAEAFGMEVHLQKIMASQDPAISLKFLEKRYPSSFNQPAETTITHKFTDADIDEQTQANIDRLLMENLQKKKNHHGK